MKLAKEQWGLSIFLEKARKKTERFSYNKMTHDDYLHTPHIAERRSASKADPSHTV